MNQQDEKLKGKYYVRCHKSNEVEDYVE
jgi:hypothetical protein